MLPWRRQASRAQSHELTDLDILPGSSSSDLLLQSAATLPLFLAGNSTGPGGSLTDAAAAHHQQEQQRPQGTAGSLRHSLSCPQPPSLNSAAACKAHHQLQHSTSASRPPLVSGMVRASSDAPCRTGSISRGSSHDLGLDEGPQHTGTLQPYYGAPAGHLNGSSSNSMVLAGNGAANGHHHQHQMQQQHGQHGQHQQQHQQQQEVERRKFTRNLLSANNKKESLERYKAIMALIEACRRRLEAQLGPAGAAAAIQAAAWSSEPLASLLQSVLDVGEALASFGNCHFPEHSNEARAILAGDYRALLRQYLSTFGFVFGGPTKTQLPHEMQEEVSCVGSLLATRCDAYDLLYDQLVRHVGLEGRGGAHTLILNHNSAASHPTTTLTANPVNTANASAASKAKALQSGLGAAAIAAAGLGALLLVRALRGGGGGGGGGGRGRRGSSSKGGGSGSSSKDGGGAGGGKPLRVPKGRNGRELLLVGQLSGCADELRRAGQNESLLRDDWRLGRHVRLAWPPGPPVPPGYEPISADACNVTQLLQELYG